MSQHRRPGQRILAGLVLLGLPSLAFAQGTFEHTWVEVRTDLFDYAPGAGVLVTWPGGKLDGTADRFGRTASTELPVGVTAEVRISSVRTTRGSTVGQLQSIVADPFTEDTSYHGHCLLVPEARLTPFYASPQNPGPGIVSDPYSEAWYAYPEYPTIAQYDFEVAIAPLRHWNQISSYLDYSGVTPPAEYVQGILVRADQDVDFGGHPIMFALDVLDHAYTTPVATVLDLTGSPLPTCFASVVADAGSHVFLRVEGGFSTGDTLILLRDGGIGATVMQSASTEPIAPASSGDGFVPCQPSPPDNSDGSFCSIPANNAATAEPDNDCGATMYPCGLSDEGGAKIVPAWVGNPPCNPAGVTSSVRICWSISGGVEFGFRLGDTLEIDLNGQIERIRCKTVTLGACTCIGTWTCEWSDKRCWKVCRDYVIFSDGQFTTVQHWSRKFQEAKGSYAIEQTTTCTPTGSGCGGSGSGQGN